MFHSEFYNSDFTTYFSNIFSYFCPTQRHTEMVEILQPFTGEAWAALEASDICQRREIIIQHLSFMMQC